MLDRQMQRIMKCLLVRLARRQHQFLMSQVTLPNEIKAALHAGEPKGDDVLCRFSLDGFEHLLGIIGHEVEAAWDEKRRARLADIQAKLVWTIETQFGILAAIVQVFPPHMAEDMQEFFTEVQSDAEPLTQEELIQRFKDWELRKFFSPDPALGGLARSQVNDLIHRNWMGPEPVILLSDSLAIEELSNAPLLLNTRLLLQILVDEGPVKLTANGRFTRKCLYRFLETFHFPPGFVAILLRYSKAVNETDVRPLATLRIVTQLAGLVRTAHGRMSITRKGVQMLKEENAGALFRLLFMTFFDKFNIACQDRMMEVDEIQATAPHMFYILSQKAATWRDAKELAHEVLIPLAEDAVPPNEHWDLPAALVTSRIFSSLERFGLLEGRNSNVEDGTFIAPDQYRKSPLFDRFFTFDLSPVQA